MSGELSGVEVFIAGFCTVGFWLAVVTFAWALADHIRSLGNGGGK